MIRRIVGPSPRELAAFEAYCRCDTRDQAAAELGVSPSTVRNHMTSLFHKLDVTNARQAAWKLWRPK